MLTAPVDCPVCKKSHSSLGTRLGGALPAIALTGYADIEHARRALVAGFQMHVAKPIDPARLTHAVANVAGAPVDDLAPPSV